MCLEGKAHGTEVWDSMLFLSLSHMLKWVFFLITEQKPLYFDAPDSFNKNDYYANPRSAFYVRTQV